MKKVFLLTAFFCISFFVKAQWHEVASATDSLKANNTIYSVCIDAVGNVYAAGVFRLKQDVALKRGAAYDCVVCYSLWYTL